MSSPHPNLRIGSGYDVHRIAVDRPLVLGGVAIPSDFGLAGHSDADVLTHALADAILGAAGLPDIGHAFPPGDPSCKDIDSQVILRRSVDDARSRGWTLVHVDATLVAEAPKIQPHLRAMKARLAETLGISPDAVGIKATTNEGLGWIGRGEGMAAHAVCLLAGE